MLGRLRTYQACRSLEDSEEEPSSPVCVTGVAAYLWGWRGSHSPETQFDWVCVAVSPLCLCLSHRSPPSASWPGGLPPCPGRLALLPLVRIPSPDKSREGSDPCWYSDGCLALTVMPPLTTRQAALPTRPHCSAVQQLTSPLYCTVSLSPSHSARPTH